MSATHYINTTCKYYLRKDLSGGDRGTLMIGQQVEVNTANDNYHTAYIIDPVIGWVLEANVTPLTSPPIPPAPTTDPNDVVKHYVDGTLVATYQKVIE
jgi:hypothetical protein